MHVCRARAAGGGATMGDSMHKREENSVRVTNLSEDTREDDLRVCTEDGFLPIHKTANHC
jgi:hypothetical protein